MSTFVKFVQLSELIYSKLLFYARGYKLISEKDYWEFQMGGWTSTHCDKSQNVPGAFNTRSTTKL